VFDTRHYHLLQQACTTIAAASAIDLDHAFKPFVGKLGAPHSHRAADDLQHVACVSAYAFQVGGRQPRNGMADVLDARLRDTQGKGCRER